MTRYFLLTLAFALSACTTTYKNQDILNKKFPQVSGNTLEKKAVVLPDHFKGKYVVVLLGFKQNSQFDIDRWLLGLTDSKVKAELYEIPTIPGMVPGMIGGRIDDGMRSGIPSELWASVITVYGDGGKVLAEFTGNERPLNARAMLLDPKGNVLFFHDRGYAIPPLKQLVSKLPARLR